MNNSLKKIKIFIRILTVYLKSYNGYLDRY